MIQIMFSDHNGMKLEVNTKENWETNKYMEIKQHTPK